MTLGDGDFRKFPYRKMIYSKLSKTASLPVTASVLRFCHSHLLMMKAKRQYYQMPNRSGSLSQNNGYPSSLTESPTQPTICGYRDTAKGEGMAKKETLMCMARCKRKDGRIADYYVHRMGGGVVIIGPNLDRYRCPPEVTNTEAARIEIARVCHVEVISITDGP